MKNKLTYATVALAIFAPFSAFVFVDASEFLFEKLSVYMWSIGMEHSGYLLDIDTTIVLGYIFTAICYIILAFLVKRMYAQVKEGRVKLRLFQLVALLAAAPIWVVVISLFGFALGIGAAPQQTSDKVLAQMAVTQKCPDDYGTDDAGSEEFLASWDKFTNDFFDAHPEATLSDWADARHQFWVDNNCTATLQRYQEASDGKADPEVMKRIEMVIQESIESH